MRFPDSAYLQRVEALTDRIEQGSAAEVVVTIASRSGSYRDVDMAWASLFALATLVLLVFSPLVVSEVGLIPNLALAYGLGWFLSRRVGAMRRLFTSLRRRESQVLDAARLAFLREALDAAPGRVGIQIYLSLLERDLEVVAGHGVLGAIGQAPLNELCHVVRQASDERRLEVFAAAFERFGDVLATSLPATAETTHGIPNRPRVVTE